MNNKYNSMLTDHQVLLPHARQRKSCFALLREKQPG
jgi:hypothetical protein